MPLQSILWKTGSGGGWKDRFDKIMLSIVKAERILREHFTRYRCTCRDATLGKRLSKDISCWLMGRSPAYEVHRPANRQRIGKGQ